MTNAPILPNEELVTFGASLQRPDGTGWNHITITLRPGASPEDRARAIQTWRELEPDAMAALYTATYGALDAAPPTPIDPPASERQRGKIEFERKKLAWSEQRLLDYARLHGITDWLKLTKPQASELIDNLLKIQRGDSPTIAPPPAVVAEMPAADLPSDDQLSDQLAELGEEQRATGTQPIPYGEWKRDRASVTDRPTPPRADDDDLPF